MRKEQFFLVFVLLAALLCGCAPKQYWPESGVWYNEELNMYFDMDFLNGDHGVIVTDAGDLQAIHVVKTHLGEFNIVSVPSNFSAWDYSDRIRAWASFANGTLQFQMTESGKSYSFMEVAREQAPKWSEYPEWGTWKCEDPEMVLELDTGACLHYDHSGEARWIHFDMDLLGNIYIADTEFFEDFGLTPDASDGQNYDSHGCYATGKYSYENGAFTITYPLDNFTLCFAKA